MKSTLFRFIVSAAFWFALSINGTTARAQDGATVQAAPKITDVRLWAARDVAPGPKIRLSLNTRNVPTVSFAVYKTDAAHWLQQVGEDNPPRPAPLAPGKPVRAWTASADADKTPRKPNPYQIDVYRSRQINLPQLPPGVYLIVVSGGGKEAWAVVNITNLAVVLKRAPHKLLAWVTDHGSGVPVSGAQVRLWDKNAKRIVTQGATRADGVCVLAAAPSDRQVMLVERPLKTPFVSVDVAGLATSSQSPDGKLVAHLQTDRPIYRPGNRVEFRAILRRTLGRGYAPEANVSVQAEVRDNRENILQRTQVTTNALGTLAAFVDLPNTCAPGAYSVVLQTPDNQSAYFPFSVAEYRKPEFQVTVTPVQPRYLAGEDASFTVKAAYYFGAPLPQAQVRYQVRSSANPYHARFGDGDDEALQWYAGGDGNLYARDTYQSNPFVAEGTATTDAQGQVKIGFKTKPGVPDSTYTITCTTIDAQRRQVEASGSIPVYAAERRIGLRTRVLAAALGTLVPIDIRLTDLDNKSAGGRVTLTTRAYVYDPKTGDSKPKTIAETTVNVPASGAASATVPATVSGEVEVVATVTDATGRKAQASLGIWVSGPNDGPTQMEREEPNLTLKLDRGVYSPGDTARVFLSTNTPTRPTLLTIEGGDIFAWKVVAPTVLATNMKAAKAAKSLNFSWSAPVELAMSPNAHVTGAQWARPAQLVAGSLVLPVPDRTRRLELSVVPDRTTYRPGDKATYSIRARDGLTGKPVANAEVALAVVDASIFALRPDTTPDPYTAYWGLRQNLTTTEMSAPEEVSGGAYQRNSPSGVAPVREKFLDTAYWNARVVTDANGAATATVELPGNLTSWRATALGVTGGTQVGRTVSTVSVSRPAMLRLATPRQFVQGDTIEVIATVHNRTNRRRTFTATLEADGVSIVGAAQNPDQTAQAARAGLALPAGTAATATVSVEPNSETKQKWMVKVGNVTASRVAKLTGTLVVADTLSPGETTLELSDALRVSVPIVPRGTPERIVVGGALAGQSETHLNLELPADRLEPATLLTVRVTNGVDGAVRSLERDVLSATPPNDPSSAASQLLIAATPGSVPVDARTVRDALSLLSRAQNGQGGWGYWDNAPPDATITARVVTALKAVRQNPKALPNDVPFPDAMMRRALDSARNLYAQTNLWEERALLAVALNGASTSQSADAINALVPEVQTRGERMSAYANLLLADALGEASGRELSEKALQTVVAGPTTAFVPAGDHPGWRATTMQTTAQALATLVHLQQDPGLQEKLARYLAHPEGDDEASYYSADTKADAARALRGYLAAQGSNRPSASFVSENELTLSVNGTPVAFAKRAPGTEETAPLVALVPGDLLKTGPNEIIVRRASGTGLLFVDADATLYKSRVDETDRGLRVLRRWETQTVWGTWEPVKPDTVVSPSSPVRVTVVAWPSSDQAEALRVIEPLPSGFEVVDSDVIGNGGREELRDQSIIHYLRAEGATPLTFRYYLRAEAAGSLLALPATGELIRRPSVRGSSDATPLTVAEDTKKPKEGESQP